MSSIRVSNRLSAIERAVRAAFARMEVDLVLSDTMPKTRDFLYGPGYAGFSRCREAVWLWTSNGRVPDEGYIHALHELEHIVYWHPVLGANVPEAIMMPWACGVLAEAGVPGRAYLQSAYTQATMLDYWWHGRHFDEVSVWKRPERSWWYRLALDAAIRSGALDTQRRPTWRRPNWDSIPLDAF